MKNIIIGIGVLIIIGIIAFLVVSNNATAPTVVENQEATDRIPVEPDGGIGDGAEPLDELLAEQNMTEEVIGQSAAGADIVAKHYGTGQTEILVVGGIHSGFAPNTVAVANSLASALESEAITVPSDLRVTVIENLNPDATRSPNTLAGRLNQNGVDLNRNFDCEWDAEGTWRDTPVSGGTAAFSEPEAAAVQTYLANNTVAAAVVFYAADGGVYASNCGGALNGEIANLTDVYANAAGYTANDEFDAYAISGDMTNWLAKEGVAAIGVLLSDYTTNEASKNQAGLEAVLNLYAN